VLKFQLIEYVDKQNTADMDDYSSLNSTWFGLYSLAEATWNDLSFDNVSNTVVFTADNGSLTVLPFLTNGSLSLKVRQTLYTSLFITHLIEQYIQKIAHNYNWKKT